MASAWNGYGLLLTEGEAEAARQAFLGRYPDLALWMDRSYAQSNEQGFITVGRLGRVIEAAWESPKVSDGSYNYHHSDECDELLDGQEWLARPLPWQNQLKRTLCCNAPIQGACADAAMRALILVDAALSAAGVDGGLVLFVHDEIVLEVSEAEAERARRIVVDAMMRAFAETFPDAPLNGLVETKVSTAWGPREEHDAAAEPVDGEENPKLPHDIIGCVLAAGFVKQNDIVWIKVDTVDGVLSGHFKPVTSKRYLHRAHELILHLTKFGDVVLDRLAVGVPFADKSNIKRRKHSQDRRCGTNVWFIPYKTVQSKAQKFGHPAGFPVELPAWLA
jgi:hypothetical protein